MRERTRARRLTEGGLLAAVTVVLGWFTSYVPYVGLVLPAPMALLAFRHGAAAAVSAWAVAAVLGGVFLGGLGGFLMMIPAGLMGLTLGMSLHARLPPGRVLLFATLGALAASLVSVALALALVGVNPLEQALQLSGEGMRGALDLYRRLGVPAEQLEAWQALTEASVQLARVVLPALVTASALLAALVDYWVVRVVLVRLGENVPWFGPFSRWRSTPLAAAMMLTGLLLGFAGGVQPWLGTVSANLMFAAAMAGTVQGLSLLWFWFERAELPRAVRWLAVLVVFWLPIAWLGLMMAGLVDAWFNFRQL